MICEKVYYYRILSRLCISHYSSLSRPFGTQKEFFEPPVF
uniref:Uncharacterized protein n=1 Tax=Lepeophtheirus salmonis TaxID=72036 RepID=A0A0K2U6I2_LEPSM